MKIQYLALLALLLSQTFASAEPVNRTTLEEAISKAPIILLAEAGQQQYDDLKPNEVVKIDTMKLECRKQTFKILKVLRNNSKLKLTANSDIEVNAKSNSCESYPIVIKRQDKQLLVHPDEKGSGPDFTVDIKNSHEKKFLFLSPLEADQNQPEHYGWFVSPQHFTDELDRKLSSLPPAGKKTIQMTGDCN